MKNQGKSVFPYTHMKKTTKLELKYIKYNFQVTI